jgi:hypothetical protein
MFGKTRTFLAQKDSLSRRAAAIAVLSLVALAGLATNADADIIDGQFTAAMKEGGTITVLNPDLSFQTPIPIAAGTSLTGTFRIDTSLLPAGNVTFPDIHTQTQFQQTGGAQWLTINATLGLATPLQMSFGRDPVVPKPADAVSTNTFPNFDQSFLFSRGLIDPGVGRCCDVVDLSLENVDLWHTSDLSQIEGYGALFTFFAESGLPLLLSGDAGLPQSGSFDSSAIDPFLHIQDSNGSGEFNFLVNGATFAGGQETSFNGSDVTGQFDMLTLSFDTIEVREPTEFALFGAGALGLGFLRRRKAA